MDVENHSSGVKIIKRLGIAPMTHMFSCGNNERRVSTLFTRKSMTPIVWRCGWVMVSDLSSSE
ncbi:hypothetical protein ACNKHO_11145 [Shigella flexneri]